MARGFGAIWEQWRDRRLGSALARDWAARAEWTPRPHRLDRPIVVSLTSHPPRFGTLALTLRALLLQSLQPDVLVLWVAAEHLESLPDEVQALRGEGLTVRGTRDLGPHTKLLPALEAWPDAHVATADDDTCYWRTWLEELIREYRPERRETLCLRAKRVRIRPDGGAAPYRTWPSEQASDTASPLTFATGIGGIFYPNGILASEVSDSQLISELCPTADDIWFHFMVRRAGGVVRRAPRSHRLHCWAGTRAEALARANVAGGGNDAQLAAMQARFGPIGSISLRSAGLG